MGNLFQPGNPGGPGRPKGSRNKLSEAFLDALHEDFAEHGAAAIAQARQESPMGYVRMIAALLPHKHEVRQGDDVSSMTDAELEAVIRHLDVLTAAHEELDDAPLPLHLAHGA